MEIHGFLRSRRSIRRFKQQEVPEDIVLRILTTATYAPSAHNRQPWRFCLLRQPEPKSRLAEAMAEGFRDDLLLDNLDPKEVDSRVERSRARITAAPLVIVLCMDTSEMDTYPDARRQQAERTMAIQSVAASGLQLLLGAHAEGLAGVWTCSPLFAPEAVRKALSLPASWEPQAMYFLGYADRTAKTKSLKPLDAIVRMF